MGKNNLLAEYRKEVDADIQNLVLKIAEEKKKREYVPYSSYVINAIKQEILSLGNACGLVMGNVHDIRISLPPPHIVADLTLSVFEYAKTNSKVPAVIAQEFSEYMNNASSREYVDAATPVNGYINILLKKEKIYDHVTKSVNELQSKYGESDIYKGRLKLAFDIFYVISVTIFL